MINVYLPAFKYSLLKSVTRRHSALALLMFFLFQQNYLQAQTKDIYVAVNGRSAAPGTLKNPVRQLSEALTLAGSAADHNNSKFKKVRIVFMGGIYPLESTIEIVQGKTWNSSVPLTIEAYKNQKVILHGGKIIDLKEVMSVSDSVYSQRFQPSKRALIKEVNLADAGIDQITKLYPVGFGRPILPAWTEVFFNHLPGTIARWPNAGSVLIDSVLSPGSIPRNGDYTNKGGIFTYSDTINRPSTWMHPENAFLSGYFNWGYADDAIPIKKIDTVKRVIEMGLPTMYGIASGTTWRAWYAYNLPEEIDEKMEYYIDVDKKILYFLPPDSLKTIEISSLGEPMIALEGVSNVTIKNIQFTCSRGMGIYMENTRQVDIQQCSFSNLGMMAISMGKGVEPSKELTISGNGMPVSRKVGSIFSYIYENTTFNREAGFSNEIKDCDIFQTGAGGVFLSGGDRLTLQSGNNAVNNCIIHDFNRINKSYSPGIWISGVGNKIVNCEIFNAPSMAILLHGNNHIIEYCNIHDVDMEVDDQGSLYYGRNPSERGLVVRYNYFHGIGGLHTTNAIYHDDGACGMSVYGNIFYKTGTVGGFIGGGSDNSYTNNIFIDLQNAMHIDKRLTNWAKEMLANGGLFQKRLEAVNYNHPPYSVQYPQLANYWKDNPAIPKRNIFSENILVNIHHQVDGDSTLLDFIKGNLSLSDYSIFKNFKEKDLGLKIKKIQEKLPGFKMIPFEKIGYHPVAKQ